VRLYIYVCVCVFVWSATSFFLLSFPSYCVALTTAGDSSSDNDDDAANGSFEVRGYVLYKNKTKAENPNMPVVDVIKQCRARWNSCLEEKKRYTDMAAAEAADFDAAQEFANNHLDKPDTLWKTIHGVNIKVEELRILLDKEMLNDELITVFHELLKKKFPQLKGTRRIAHLC
jgi:hypothetical protein